MGAEGLPADAAEARKRRKAILSQKQEEGDNITGNDKNSCPVNNDLSVIVQIGEKSAINGVIHSSQPQQNLETHHDNSNVDGIDNESGNDDGSTGSTHSAPSKKRKTNASSSTKRPSKKKIQVRYDPDIPMEKEQLASWRREARRVRNRESAAASRQRIRSRITELEEELDEWRLKYKQAMQRLEYLEDNQRSQEIVSCPNGHESNEALAAAVAAAASLNV